MYFEMWAVWVFCVIPVMAVVCLIWWCFDLIVEHDNYVAELIAREVKNDEEDSERYYKQRDRWRALNEDYKAVKEKYEKLVIDNWSTYAERF